MSSILILKGLNLNRRGTRGPIVHGALTPDARALCEATGQRLGLRVDVRQPNHARVLVDRLHGAGAPCRAGALREVIFNASVGTRTQVARRSVGA